MPYLRGIPQKTQPHEDWPKTPAWLYRRRFFMRLMRLLGVSCPKSSSSRGLPEKRGPPAPEAIPREAREPREYRRPAREASAATLRLTEFVLLVRESDHAATIGAWPRKTYYGRY
jgi:hypothetical protein